MSGNISTSSPATHESLTKLLVNLLNEAGVERSIHSALRCFTAVPDAGSLPLIMVHGRVSSGKSSLINALLGDDILPVSSVPSSVVPVFIAYGTTPAATAYFAAGDFRILDGAGLYHACTGKMPEVTHVTISLPSPFLKPGLILVDTPPFDHHDPQVRKIAQLLLGQGDLALLLLEYDLVNTEENRHALHSIIQHSIPLIPAVTQTDRHDDRRPIAEFTSAAAGWLEQAGVDRSNVRFISVRQMKGIEDLQNMVHDKIPLLTENVQKQRERQVLHLAKVLQEGLGLAESKQIELSSLKAGEKVDRIVANIQELKELPPLVVEKITATAENVLQGMLPSEYLKNAAASLVESCTPNFRSGIFNLEAQRRQERQKRVTALLDEIEKYAEKEVLWRIREMATKEAEALYPMGTAGKKALSSLSTNLDSELLMRLAFSYANRPDGVAAYTSAVVKQITDAFKNRLNTIIDVVRADARDYAKGQLPQLEKDLELVRVEQDALAAELQRFAGKAQLLAQTKGVVHDLLAVRQMVPTEEVPLSPYVPPDEAGKTAEVSSGDERENGLTIAAFNELRYRLLGALQRATQTFSHSYRSEALTETINRRMERIKGERFSFVILGPPASGRAALANALAGRQLLPESDGCLPLVTLSAAESGERARVIFKDQAAVALELESTLSVMGYGDSKKSLQEVATILPSIAAEVSKSGEPGVKGHVDYIRAAADIEDVLPLLGTEMEISVEELRTLPVKSWHFVREIIIEGASDFLSQGITLRIVEESHILRDGNLSAAMATTDGVIILFPYHHVAGAPTIPFISRLRRAGASAEDPCFFVVNGADSTTGMAKEHHEVERRTRSLLEEAGIGNPRVFLVSADLYLMAAGFSQGTQNLQLLQLYKRMAMCDRNSQFPDPSTNRDASNIPALTSALERRGASAKSAKIVADGCATTISFLENLLAGKLALLGLLLQDMNAARTTSQRRLIASSEARLALAALKEELNGFMENALKKIGDERRSLLGEARISIDSRTRDLVAELFATIDPGQFTAESLKRELKKRAAQFVEELSMALSLEQDRIHLSLFNSFRHHTRRLEEKAAVRISALKDQFYLSVMDDRMRFSGNNMGITACFPFERFSSTEFTSAEMARDVRGCFDFLKDPETIVGSIRSAIQKTINAELATLFVAMDLDVSDIVEGHAGDFLQRLLIYLERDLESFILQMEQAVVQAEQYLATEENQREDRLESVESEGHEIEEQIRLLREIQASIVPVATEAMQ